MTTNASAGNTLAEYSILIGLVVVASIASLSLLGDSTNGLFRKTDQDLRSGSAQKLISLQFGNGGSAGSGNSGNQTLEVTANTTSPTQPLIGIAEGNSSGTNATAAEGATNKTEAVYQNANFALQMENRLSPNMDPALYEWASQITQYSKLSAGAAGVLNNLSAFQTSTTSTAIGGQQANNDSITNSLIGYQTTLKNLISNPPAGVNLSDVQFYSTLGSNVANNINQQTNGKTITTNLANNGNTVVLADFGQYMNPAQLDQAIHKTAQSGEAKKVSQNLDTVMNSSDTLNNSN